MKPAPCTSPTETGGETGAATEASAPTWWLYLLLCEDGRTYTGIALDVEARFAMHVRGKGGKFTRANKPVAILGAQPFANRSAASKAEHALKQLSKPAKLAWAHSQAPSRFSAAVPPPR